jgi:hypothetical protein
MLLWFADWCCAEGKGKSGEKWVNRPALEEHQQFEEATEAVHTVHGDYIPFEAHRGCTEEWCVCRSLSPVNRTELQDWVRSNEALFDQGSPDALLSKARVDRTQLWLLLTDNTATKQYVFPLWNTDLKQLVLKALLPHVAKECQILRVHLAMLDPSRNSRDIGPHIDSGRWSAISHRVHVPLQGSPTYFFWHHTDSSTQEKRVLRFNVSELPRFEFNNKVTHSVIYAGDLKRVHLIADVLEHCPPEGSAGDFMTGRQLIVEPSSCTYSKGALECAHQEL